MALAIIALFASLVLLAIAIVLHIRDEIAFRRSIEAIAFHSIMNHYGTHRIY